MQIKNFDFSNVKNVVFDMDGVLLNSEQDNLGAWLNAGRDLDIPLYEVMDLWYTCLGVTAEYEKQLITKFNIDYNDFMKAVDKYSSKDIPQLFKGVSDVLKAMKEKHISIGLASSSRPEKINRVLTDNHIEEYFTQVVSGRGLPSKPLPDIYTKAIHDMGADLEYTIAIEDSHNGIQSALSAGVSAVIAMEDTQSHLIYVNHPKIFIAKDLSEVIELLK